MTGGVKEATEGSAPPDGEVTFLFTDVEGSTALWENDADAMTEALAEHDERMRGAIARHSGYVFTTAGDSFAVAFGSPADAVAATIDAQRSLAEPCGTIALRVRMGLHTGVASIRDGDYFGSVVNRCARLMSAAHGGQVLISGSTKSLVERSLDDEIELIDLGEHRLKDLRQPERVYQLRHPTLDTGFPPLRTLEGSWSNLPIQLTGFIGRDRELDEIRELLEANRLVTLTGSGGAGKTRLAIQVAADTLEDHPGGIRLIELAALTDPHFVADEVAERVGAQATPDMPLIRTIASRIGDLQMLLVLDNCEHLIEPVADLAEQLLRACPQLRILATSQEALRIGGEARYRVPSLTLPEGSDPASAAESDAVELFTERAMVVRPDFAVNADNVDSVVSICRRLDGIPLALELAAARLRVLSPAQISERLDERFRLLGGSGRGVAERHQTLEAAMDWSHDLLPDTERAVFRRLSVFAGDFTIEAAESVCDGEPVDSLMVLDLLTSLVDKSLVVPEHDTGETRYQLPESVRAYGSGKLVAADESVTSGSRHADRYVVEAEVLQATRRGGDLHAALAGLDSDEDNIRAALRFLLDNGRLESAARIVGAIGHLWYSTGSFREGIEWCRELFESQPDLPDDLLASALHVYATLLGSWEQPHIGAEMLEREVALRRTLGDPARLAPALNNLGNLQNDIGQTVEAEASLLEAIEQFRSAGEPATLALASLGYGSLHAGSYEDAHKLYAEARDEATAVHDGYGIALANTSLGQCALYLGDLAEARLQLDAAREGFAALGVRPGVSFDDLVLGLVDRAEQNSQGAARSFLSALENPDAHWYLATKFWILQSVASVTEDPVLGARLIGVTKRHYDAIEEVQPAWVISDLRSTRALLESRLGSEQFAREVDAGRRMELDEAIVSARAALRGLLGIDQ